LFGARIGCEKLVEPVEHAERAGVPELLDAGAACDE